MDVFNALTCDRSFRKRLTPFRALNLMKNDFPGNFDPELLTAFFNSIALK